MILWIGVTDKEYDLDYPQERFRLRDDLVKEGFFSVEENKRLWKVFDQEKVSWVQLSDLLNTMKLFEASVQKVQLTKN